MTITANQIARRILFPLLLLTLPLASAEAFSPSTLSSRDIHSRNLNKSQLLASKPNSQPDAAAASAFVSSTTSENAIDTMVVAKKKREYSWTKPTLELAIPALVASIAGEILL